MTVWTRLSEQLLQAAALLGAAGVLWRGIVLPLRRVLQRLERLDEDTADLLWDRLQQAQDDRQRQGWCSAAEKQRLAEMHRRYAAKGRNHLAANYEQALLALPEHPAVAEGRKESC